MSIKKLGVCGDSYMSAISYNENDLDNGYNNHFTEILSRKIGCDVVTFARGACSNQTIRLQIDEIIKEKPDLVIIGTTSADRFELPICDLYVDDYFDKNKNNDCIYNKNNGLYNIDHTNWIDKSAEKINFSKIKPTLISDTLNNLFNGQQYPKNILNNDELDILKKWFNRYYDCKWKIQQDTWIVSDGLRKLQDNNIKFYCLNWLLFEEDLNCFGDKIIQRDSYLSPLNYTSNNTKYRFHTTIESQEILSNKWFDFLKLNNLL